MSISRNQLRAARVLLCLSQEEVSALADVGVTTIGPYETGAGFSNQNAKALGGRRRSRRRRDPG